MLVLRPIFYPCGPVFQHKIAHNVLHGVKLNPVCHPNPLLYKQRKGDQSKIIHFLDLMRTSRATHPLATASRDGKTSAKHYGAKLIRLRRAT